MRIISGSLRGRPIECPPGDHVRPTLDRVRENIFNILTNYLDFDGIHIIDLYAGSGAFGFESISRGAASVCFIDLHKLSCKSIEKNAMKLGLQKESFSIVNKDVFEWINLPHTKTYQLIFADPPYELSILENILKELKKSTCFSSAILVFETHSKLPPITHPLLITSRVYGPALIYFFDLSKAEL